MTIPLCKFFFISRTQGTGHRIRDECFRRKHGSLPQYMPERYTRRNKAQTHDKYNSGGTRNHFALFQVDQLLCRFGMHVCTTFQSKAQFQGQPKLMSHENFQQPGGDFENSKRNCHRAMLPDKKNKNRMVAVVQNDAHKEICGAIKKSRCPPRVTLVRLIAVL